MDLRLFGRILIKNYSYHLMVNKELSNLPETEQRLSYSFIHKMSLTENCMSIDDDCGYYFTYQRFKKKYSERVLDFVFYENTNIVGYAYIFLKGTKDKIFNINNAEAYISQIAVLPSFRGKKYSAEMIRIIFDYLHGIGIKELYLAVNPDNVIAVNLYKKTGFKEIKNIKYMRIFKINVPRHSI